MTLSSLIESDISAVFMNTSDFAIDVSVSRESTTVTMTALAGTQVAESQDSNGFSVSSVLTFLEIESSKYNFGSGVVTPITIDEFVLNSKRFEAYQPDDKDQCWEYTDDTQLMLKVYLTEVAA